ncbi:MULTISPECIES: sulfur oxidation c-type cytochrome SoxA [unclassified Ruegeria]|uniref:sulfur oxidation c-type cytochrome SoxA n=1 Tax=unclassified Ruegeria TaxID=2625375 RepID=UPI0014893329|nr:MULTISPECIES: sulfur oxidation c-type cytochrome SoxA [unclassified Ruegeria]NOD35578.1 sulfur oxidation c-type cytochrome SoxA [Ruegeria sp. HKCCD7296]NOD48139.1 sulfur oxidation c-type cytochrome SoxA [Ruegeria sp. HKCCD5849]NOD53500.1 sulfur oxidation c-type cytochrome SoxA [Ruegeria sp. HKCCD5851]NOD70022.1 sulfur oxidation c-type cytochrome SoxA [Ruegeria sp. HKCCD7303]NOE35940.1 sulfur oxidation c-type cytochrome SoxA [Ruegeria sp. HKCCD7318]
MNTKALTAIAAILVFPAAAMAGPDEDNLVINDELDMTSVTEAPAHLENLDTIYSGWHFRTDETQALQIDDFDNPAMIFVDQAADLFETVDGAAGESCASCHDGAESFKGLQASMPKVDAETGKLVVMEDLINKCRTDRMEADAWKWSGGDMQGMVALIGLQSRGMPMNVAIDGDAAPYWEQGKEMYYTRYGQLELSCANCHEDNWGNMIRADHLSQGMINGFPTYRLKQAKLISRHNRFRGCIRDTRAETFAEGSDEFRALELYVASRGNGLSVETPAVRQ